MMSLASRFFNAVWRGPISRNLGGAIGVQLCLLVSGTLAARLLGPEDRGYLAILTVLPSSIGQLGAVGISLAATYFLSAGRIDGSEVIAVLRKPAAIQIVVLTLINSAIILAYTFISGAPILLAACLSLVQLPAAICIDYGIAFLLGARRHAAMGVTRMLSALLTAGGMVVLYVIHKRSVTITTAVASAAFVFTAAVALMAGGRALRLIRARSSIVRELGIVTARKELLAFGRRGYVGYLSPVDSFRIDQLVVGFLISPRALGIYVVGSAFTNFTRLVAVNIGMSSTSEVAARANSLERERAVQRTLVLAGGVITLVTIGLGLFVIAGIPVLFGDSYRSSIPVAEILLVAGWMLSMKRIAVDAMRGAGETGVGTRAEIVNLTLFLIVCGPCGLLLGGPGVALALVFGSAGGSLVLVRRLRHLNVISSAEPSADDFSPRAQDV